MKYACLFREKGDPILVSAEDVKAGFYSRNEEFVDPEYEFKVQFVRGSRNNGGPYFRYYYSYEDYKRLFPNKASRYEIVVNMRRYHESNWHKKWKENVSDFCSIEKYIKNPLTKKWKYADGFIDETKTCLEFQHSYIALDFEERNKFYSDLSIKTIWLYDLSMATVHQDKQGNIEILEDNARGFFRISERPENLKNNFVYIQVKSGMIYRVKELLRRDSSTDKKSTIRYFKPSEIYTEKQFINAINCNKIGNYIPRPLKELWDAQNKWMTILNTETNDVILINHDGNGGMFRDFKTGCIKYKCINNKDKEYSISHRKENSPIWILVGSKKKT